MSSYDHGEFLCRKLSGCATEICSVIVEICFEAFEYSVKVGYNFHRKIDKLKTMQSEITLKLAMNKMQEREATLLSGINKLEKLIKKAESELKWDVLDNFKKRLLILENERLSIQKSLVVYQSTLNDFQVSRSTRSDFEFSSRQDPKPLIKKKVVNLEHCNSSNASEILKNNIQIKSVNQQTINLLTEIENDIKVIQNTSKILIDKILRCKLQIQESSRLNELLDKKMQVDFEIDTELEDLKKAMDLL